MAKIIGICSDAPRATKSLWKKKYIKLPIIANEIVLTGTNLECFLKINAPQSITIPINDIGWERTLWKYTLYSEEGMPVLSSILINLGISKTLNENGLFRKHIWG